MYSSTLIDLMDATLQRCYSEAVVLWGARQPLTFEDAGTEVIPEDWWIILFTSSFSLFIQVVCFSHMLPYVPRHGFKSCTKLKGY